eukprot:354169-Chlamydomonas_euryale.AAC.20
MSHRKARQVLGNLELLMVQQHGLDRRAAAAPGTRHATVLERRWVAGHRLGDAVVAVTDHKQPPRDCVLAAVDEGERELAGPAHDGLALREVGRLGHAVCADHRVPFWAEAVVKVEVGKLLRRRVRHNRVRAAMPCTSAGWASPCPSSAPMDPRPACRPRPRHGTGKTQGPSRSHTCARKVCMRLGHVTFVQAVQVGCQ